MVQRSGESTLTVMFTDVEASTEIATQQGDAAARRILAAQRDLVERQLAKHGGRHIETAGDSTLSVFPAARPAIACAVDIQNAVERLNRERADSRFRLRIGMAIGDVIEESGGVVGATVTGAARIVAMAKGGQILVSELVKFLAGAVPGVSFNDMGLLPLKGFPEPWRVFEAVMHRDATTVPLLERTPLVGRDVESLVLQRSLDQVADGHGVLITIGGEAGIGKTRLAEQVLADAVERGLSTLASRCQETEGALHYGAIASLIESAARRLDRAAFERVSPQTLAEVARIAPELRRLFPDIRPPAAMPPDEERHLLFNSVRDLFRGAARHRPLVVLIDDLQWSDESTLAMLEHLIEDLDDTPALLLITYRDDEAPISGSFTRTLQSFVRHKRAHRVNLRRLSADKVRTMLTALGASEPPAALTEAIYQETDGNPLFVEEVYKHLYEERQLFDAEGRWRPDLHISEVDVPATIRAVLDRRLERLSPSCRRVLSLAAVVGRTFHFRVVQEMAGIDVETLVDTIEEGETSGMVSADLESQEGQYRFPHELVRQTLLSELSTVRRQQLHHKAAETLERLYEGRIEVVVSDIAHHLQEAGGQAPPELAARYHRLAADQARDAFAFEHAFGHYRAALRHLPGTDRAGRAKLLEAMGRTQRNLGHYQDALNYWREAIEIEETTGAGEEGGQLCAEICDLLGRAGRLTEVNEFARRGLEMVGPQASRVRTRLLSELGLGLSFEGNYGEADSLLAEALVMAEQVGDPHLLGNVARNKAVHHSIYLEPKKALANGTRAVELLRSTNSLWALADAMGSVQNAQLFLGHHDQVLQIGAELEPLAQRLGDLTSLCFAVRDRSLVELGRSGDLDGYERFAAQDLQTCETGSLLWLPDAYTCMALVSFWRGDLDRALAHVREATVRETNPMRAGFHAGFQFVFTAYQGRREAAMALFEESRIYLPKIGAGSRTSAWRMLLCATEGLAVLGERAEAGRLYPLLRQAIDSGTIGSFFDFRLLQAMAGVSSAAAGRWDRAEEHFKEALRQAHALHLRMQLAEVNRFYAAMLIDRSHQGDRERSREMLREAEQQYDDLGMPLHVGLAQRLREAAMATPSAPTARGGTALSRREMEVAALVARGLTNRQIAERLFLSERTAENHVEHIRDKLGFTSRAQIAAWVAEKGLISAERP